MILILADAGLSFEKREKYHGTKAKKRPKRCFKRTRFTLPKVRLWKRLIRFSPFQTTFWLCRKTKLWLLSLAILEGFKGFIFIFLFLPKTRKSARLFSRKKKLSVCPRVCLVKSAFPFLGLLHENIKKSLEKAQSKFDLGKPLKPSGWTWKKKKSQDDDIERSETKKNRENQLHLKKRSHLRTQNI